MVTVALQLSTIQCCIAGFVANVNMSNDEQEAIRCTPQAFSHFTAEQSRGELIVVDIQGVDDLYTDPQVLLPSPSRSPSQ